MKKQTLYTLLIGLAALALSACGAAATPTPGAEITLDDGPNLIITEGRLIPAEYAELSFLASGQVSKVMASEGDTVKAGQALVQLDDLAQQQAIRKAQLAVEQAQISVASAQHTLDSLIGWSPNKNQINAAQADVANAEAAVKVAQAAYDKVSFNPDISSMPQSLGLEQATNNFNKAQAQLDLLASSRPDVAQARNNLDAAKLALSVAQLDLENAQTALDRMALRAPLAGTVTTLNARPGESIAAGQPVATVADLKSWVIKTDDLTELQVVRVAVGQKVTIVFDALPDKTFHGEVKHISTQFVENHGDITYTVTITLTDPDPALRWGMTATVEFVE